ncbi:MAG: hypothetical protein ACM336_19995 [Acidobacteriota bacterium]
MNEVETALRALAESARDCRAPERVERALLAAFAQRRRRRAVSPWWGLAAAGLAACAALAVWLRAPERVEAPAPVAVKPVVAAAPVSAPPPVVKQAATRRPPPRAPRKRREVTTRFYPLQYADAAADLAKGPIVRVEVPRTALAAFGLPYDQDRADPVQADVALDTETGMARAIRFVRVEN